MIEIVQAPKRSVEQRQGTATAPSQHERGHTGSTSCGGSSRPLLRTSGLAKSFGGRQVLRGVDLELHQGEVVLLRGDNGSGKTTLLNILSGNLAPDSGTIHLSANGGEETFRFPRRWWDELNPADHFLPERVARGGVGRTWQETRLFPSLPLVDNVAVATPSDPGEDPLNVLFRPGPVQRARTAANSAALDLLDSLGLNDRAGSSADMISLGQTKRVAVARAVCAGGRILFLDEPLAGLDAWGIETVLHLLQQLAREHRITLVIIEHVWNAHHILGFATTAWTLRDGRLMVEDLRSHKGTTADSVPSGSVIRLQRLTSGLRQVASMELPRGGALSVYRFPDRRDADAPLLEVSGLVVRRGRRSVIGENDAPAAAPSGLGFRLHDGDLAILQAPNGWGKTTLLDALAGLLPVTAGTLRILGRDVTREPAWERSRKGLHLLRTANRAFPSLTVAEAFALGGAAVPPTLDSLRDQGMQQLSGGEQQAVSLGRMAASKRHVYLLDEPFSALDLPHVGATFQAIRELAARQRTAIFVALPAALPNPTTNPSSAPTNPK